MSTSKDPALLAAQLLESVDHDDSVVLFESEDFSDDDSAYDLDSELESTIVLSPANCPGARRL